eukprot:1160442-Pelagomonas_calceolata.AAC.1
MGFMPQMRRTNFNRVRLFSGGNRKDASFGLYTSSIGIKRLEGEEISYQRFGLGSKTLTRFERKPSNHVLLSFLCAAKSSGWSCIVKTVNNQLLVTASPNAMQLISSATFLRTDDLALAVNSLWISQTEHAIATPFVFHPPIAQFDVAKCIRTDTITYGLENSLSSGNWTIKRFRMERKGVTQVCVRVCVLCV